MVLEWDSSVAMTAGETLKNAAENTTCEAAVCEGGVVLDGVEKAEEYFQKFSDMIRDYSEALYNDGENIEKKTVYLNMIDTNTGHEIMFNG